MTPHLETSDVTIWHGDCIDVMAAMPANLIRQRLSKPIQPTLGGTA